MTGTHVTSIPIRLSDIDSMGHVNNGRYPDLLSEARAGYYEEVLEFDLRAADTVVVHLELDYFGEITRGDTVDVAAEITDLGESSMTMEYTLRVDDEVVSRGETVQVMYDRAAGTSRPIPRAWRYAIEAHEGW
ncbi:acyl-CoA thioesterase [Halorubrum sp. JWXQ-INN 858]|uniref:acyl-CoA thioesterase n=1 Tax=Halorubrum sp. JWXQ-INN 858 TaxID=2690782 RepID=UPI00135C89AC|nr:thioesterase family protein [Halorubrum sp. JWXQ-INN 858]MWV64566.1 acyl-CoA thioesterase [Halorubrum sp. JWXQ-INN 858]